MKVKITRSESWIRAQRLARGENVDRTTEIDVKPADLSEANRAALLDWSNTNTYPDCLDGVSFNTIFEPSSWSNHGREDLVIDAEWPTFEQVDAALTEAFRRIAARKAQRDAEIAAKQDEENAKTAARLLLADEIKKINDRVDSLTSNRDDICRDRKILAEFLASFPDDALRGALKAYAKGNVDDVQEEIENASPVTIFNDTGDI